MTQSHNDTHPYNQEQIFYIRIEETKKYGNALFQLFDMAFNKAGTDKLCFVPSNDMMKPSPPNITNINKYPVNPVEHQQYSFHIC